MPPTPIDNQMNTISSSGMKNTISSSGKKKLKLKLKLKLKKKLKLKSNQQPRLSGFFHARLWKLKSSKRHKSKLSSKKSVDNQISMPWIDNQITSTSCQKHKKMTSNCSSSNSLVATKYGSIMTGKMPSINYQFTSTSSCPPIPKSHQGKMTLFDNLSPILKKHRKMPDNQLKMRRIHDLPEELLAEILKLLPVKYILRCRCVQKSWNYLIQSAMFITLQLNYQKKNITITTPNHHHPKYLYFENNFTQVLTLRFDHVQCQEYCTLKCPPGLPVDAWRKPSYGLICMSTTMHFPLRCATPEIYLWNPLVQKYKTLPDSPLPFTNTKWKALAFGFIPETNDYVVLHIVKPRLHLGPAEPNPHSIIIGVYSLNTNSWKTLSQDHVFVRDINYNDAVFINGAAFWVGISLDRRKIIMCFDTKTDTLREISLPNWVAHSSTETPIIYQLGQSIAYFVWDDGYDYFDMWVLNYDSINEFSWEKKMSISPNEDIRVEVMGVRNNGEPVLARSYNLISYNLDNHEAKNFVDSWDSWTPYKYYEEGFAPPFIVIPFVESLVLLNFD